MSPKLVDVDAPTDEVILCDGGFVRGTFVDADGRHRVGGRRWSASTIFGQPQPRRPHREDRLAKVDRVSTPKYTRTDSATARPNARVPATPNVPISTAGLAFDRWEQGERFGGGEIPLADLGGAQRIGVNIMELVPGRQSCPLHYHLREEEHFYVLEGRCILRIDDARHTMGPGDYVCFPAGTGVAHAFENPYPEPCRVMAIGLRLDDEIAVYPDSRKIKLRALGMIVPLPDQTLDYWHGESADVPLPHTVTARQREAERQHDQAAERQREIDAEIAAMKKRLGLE